MANANSGKINVLENVFLKNNFLGSVFLRGVKIPMFTSRRKQASKKKKTKKLDKYSLPERNYFNNLLK